LLFIKERIQQEINFIRSQISLDRLEGCIQKGRGEGEGEREREPYDLANSHCEHKSCTSANSWIIEMCVHALGCYSSRESADCLHKCFRSLPLPLQTVMLALRRRFDRSTSTNREFDEFNDWQRQNAVFLSRRHGDFCDRELSITSCSM